MNSTRHVIGAAIATVTLIFLSNILYFNSVYSQIGNLSNNPLLNLSSLVTSLVKPISGIYDNPSLGYRIELPPGWNGTEMNVLTQMVIAAPADSNSLFKNGLNPSGVEKNHTMMTIIGIDKKAFDTLKNISQSMMSGANISSMTNMFDQYKKDAKCDKTVAPVVINGATGQQISYVCQGPNDNGKTFGEEINLSNSTGIQSTRSEIVASGDNVDVSWWEKSDGKDQPMIRTSNDGGKTFDEATVLTANSTSSS